MNDDIVTEAVKNAILERFPSEDAILDAIMKGVKEGFHAVFARDIFGDEVLNAIADGTREALSKGR